MALFQVTAPATEPISTADAKLHCKVDSSDDDALIDALVKAAREQAEAVTHRALISQTWDLKLDAFPCNGEIWLPKPPVSSVTSITYLDTTGVSQTWASSNYRTDLPTGPWARKARITPDYNVVLPSTYRVPNAVTVRFVCGYGATASAIPSSVIAAMKLSIGHWYRNRDAVVVGVLPSELPLAVQALLWPFKAF